MFLTVKVSDSPLSKEIQEYKFPIKFSTSNFDYYSGVNDAIQLIRHFGDKMVIYALNDPIMCLAFPSSLKGSTSDWFYSLPLHYLHNFKEITKAFLTQYLSHQETKKNRHHLLSVKMREGDSLKSYISFFQS